MTTSIGTTTDLVVETANLSKRFGDRTVVQRVDLEVPHGVAFGYLGPNRACKTTLIRLLLGLAQADEGSMKLLGLPVPARRTKALARVGADPELLILDEPMNGLDPAGIQGFRAFVREFVAEGLTIVLSSHLLDEVRRRAALLRSSTAAGIVAQGPIATLRDAGRPTGRSRSTTRLVHARC